MSVASTTAKRAQQQGLLLIMQKLGMVAPKTHAPRTAREVVNFSAHKMPELWREIDAEPAITGEESSLGMTSAGGVNKNGALEDGGYGDAEGPYAVGSFDANQVLPTRYQRLLSAIQEAFRSNEDYDQSYAPEAAVTQPHGAKLGTAAMGIGSALKPLSLTPRNTQQLSALPKLPKLKNVTDPRADKPPNMNLQHGIQTNAYADNTMQSIGSPNTRFTGSPI